MIVSNSCNVEGSSVWLGWVAVEEVVEVALADVDALTEAACDAEATLDLVEEALAVAVLATRDIEGRLECVANVVLDKGLEEATALTMLFDLTVPAAEQIAVCTWNTICRENRRRVHIMDNQYASRCQ